MEQVNNPPVNQSISRPWQGTTLVVFNIIGLVFNGLSLIFLIIMTIKGSSISTGILQTFGGEASGFPIGDMVETAGMVMIIPYVLSLILGVFLTLGTIKGQKWSIITMMVFTILALLSVLASKNVIAIIIPGFLLYLEIMCLKNLYYNKKVT